MVNLVSPTLKLSIFSTLVFGLIACQTPPLEVHSSASPFTSVSQYSTYNIESLNDPNIEIIPIVDNAIANELNAKGYTQVDASKADLIIKYKIKVKQDEQLRTEAIPVAGTVYSRTTTESINEASMLVNAVDPKTGEVVWKATTIRDLHTVNEEVPFEERAKISMGEVFEDFPSK
jgi:hypothetical protein